MPTDTITISESITASSGGNANTVGTAVVGFAQVG